MKSISLQGLHCSPHKYLYNDQSCYFLLTVNLHKEFVSAFGIRFESVSLIKHSI